MSAGTTTTTRSKRRARRTLQAQILRVVLAAATLPLLVIGVGYGCHVENRHLAESGGRLAEISATLAREIDAHLEHHRSALVATSELLELTTPDAESVRRVLHLLQARHPDFEMARVIDATGTITPAPPPTLRPANPPFPSEPSATVANPVQATTESSPVGTASPGRSSGADAVITLSTAILGPDGEELGIVEGTLRLGRFVRFAENFPAVPGLRLLVLDGARRVILSTDPDQPAGLSPTDDGTPPTGPDGADRTFVTRREVVDGVEQPSRLTSRAFTASGLLIQPWTILAQREVAGIRAAARRQVWVLGGCLALVVAGLLASAGILAGHLTRPLERLVQWSRDLAIENVSICHLPPRTTLAEIADLQDHLRAMASRLQLAYGDLQRAQEVLLEAHDQLEARVTDRTRKLRETNSLLREEAEERSRAQNALQEANLRLEESVREARSMAENAAEVGLAKSRFLATTSQEIRTRMTAIIGMTHLLLDTQLPPEQRDYARVIRDSGLGLLVILDDILDLSNIATSTLELQVAEFDLVPLVEDVAATLAPRAHKKGLELVCAIDPGVPPRLVGDAGRIRQILTHLGGNAVKFTDQGNVQIRVHLAHATEGAATLRFTFADTGVGIPLDDLPTLFTPFTRAGASAGRRPGGTGLGLAIAKELAGLMNGSVGVESDPGRGSTFWVILPLQRPTHPTGSDSTETRTEPDLDGVRVLVVDPFPASRVATTTLLHAWGCDTDFAGDTESAFLLLTPSPSQKGFDVVLVDQSAPGVASGEFNRSIRARPELQGVEFILFTARGPETGTESATGSDAPPAREDCFGQRIPKPVRQSALRAAVARRGARTQTPSEQTHRPGDTLKHG